MTDDQSHSDPTDLSRAFDSVAIRTAELTRVANAFGRAMTGALAQSVTGARGFDEALKSIALRMSGMAVQLAFGPLTNVFGQGMNGLFGSLFGANLKAAAGAVKPFAAGGVINTPSYFPLTSGGVGLAGEAGPEAIMPLARGPDGRLGVAAGGGTAPHITINIATPDAESFRRSEVFVTGQIARAVARGQRGL